MKNFFVLLIITFQITFSAFAVDELNRKSPAPKKEQLPQSEVLFGVNVTSFDYEEELAAPLKSTEKGTFFIPYVQGKVFVPGLNRSFFNLEIEYSGRVQSLYDGSDRFGAPIVVTNNHVFFRAETDFYWNFRPYFYIFAGYGYRYWDRYLSSGTGYKEIYTWGYYPVGLLYEVPISDQFSFGVDLTYVVMTDGKLKVIFSETVSGGDDTDLTLGNKPGYRIRFPLQFHPAQSRFSYQIMPWYEGSEIGASEFVFNATIGGPIKEPASRTIQYGILLGLKAQF